MLPTRQIPAVRAVGRRIAQFGPHFWLAIVVAIGAVLAGAWPNRVLAEVTQSGSAASPTTKLVAPGDMKSGALLLKANEDGRFVEAPRLGADYDLTVSGPTVRGRVSQIFHNPTDGWVEAVYVYPLSEGAAVDSLKMVIGERVVVAEIKERQQAKRVFEAAKAAGQKAALMEEERPNIFTNSVANIGPGEKVVIQFEYQEPVKQSGDTFSLRLPLVVGPRYNPAPLLQVVDLDPGGQGWGQAVSDPVPDRARIEPPVLDPAVHAPTNPVTIAVTLSSGFALGDVKSHHHAVDIESPREDQRTVRLRDRAVAADHDFELTWTPVAASAPSVGLFRERVGDSDYILAFVTPPVVAETKAAPSPREVILVIDNSGSMGGTSIREAKASLLYALGRLKPEDRFNVIRFDHTFDVLYPSAVPATADKVGEAKRFVDRLQASGGTEMLPAMRAALVDNRGSDNTFLRQVVFLTDGAIGNENQLLDVIARDRGRSRVFMVGIGSAPNTFLMTRAAEIGRGTFTHIGSPEQVEERMRALYERLESPVVTGLTAKVTGRTADMTPEILPDLYRREPLVLTAKIDPRDALQPASIDVGGMIGEQPWKVSIPLQNAAVGHGVSKLWARRKIADREVARSLRLLTPEDADRHILALALEHQLVSRLTSLVAVDRTPSRPDGARLARADVPLNLPAGWEFDKVFGEKPALGRGGRDILEPGQHPNGTGQRAGSDADPLRRQVQVAANGFTAVATAGQPRPGSQLMQAVPLPRTATDAELRLMLGLALLLASTLLLALRRQARGS